MLYRYSGDYLVGNFKGASMAKPDECSMCCIYFRSFLYCNIVRNFTFVFIHLVQLAERFPFGK